jgi:hypothetical protein
MSTLCASKISWMTVADQVVHALHLEVLGEAPLDVVDERELGVALTGLLEQPRVLERDAEAAGERREQADVRLAERVLAVEVLERDARRSPRRRLRAGPAASGGHLFRAPHRGRPARRSFLDTLASRSASASHHVSAEGLGVWGRRVADAPSIEYGHVIIPESAIEHADVQHLRIEDFDQPVAEQVVHGLHSRFSARPRWTSLITASSALRCLVSSNSRAFSSATLKLPARVVRRRCPPR